MEFLNSEVTVSQFADMGLHPSLLTAIARSGWDTPTPIQSESVPVALKGNDLIGVAQTGSGKTLAYVASALTLLAQKKEARALVLSTSRETAEQVYRVFLDLTKELPLSVCLVAPGASPKAMNEQASQLKKNPRIIVATPGRINDHLRTNKLLLKGLEILVIDEADRMLEMGFEPQLRFMQSTLRGERQTWMFAASFGKWAEPIAQMFLRPNAFLVRSKAAETPVSSLKQKVLFLSHAQKNNRLLDEVKKMKDGVIVFTDSQESCVLVGNFLAHKEFSSDFVHGDMNAGHRNRVLRDFREKKIQIMVTTDLLARGLDIPHVNHVVNFDLPYKFEDFLHRIGRTARAGRVGTAISFVTPSDGRTFRKIKTYIKEAEEETVMTGFKFDERD